MTAPEVIVIGGGVAGCATAALLAEAGAFVRLYEREAVAAGASGRNSGLLQHPMDPALVPVYESSLALYSELGHGFVFPAEPTGVLVVSPDPESLAADRGELAASFPELEPEWLEGAELADAEPALAPGLFAYRLATGRPVPPGAATRAWAERARAAGARIEVGQPGTLARRNCRVTGVLVGGRLEPASTVVIAAGPWTPEALGADPAWRPVAPLWGVVAQVRSPAPPRHALEETGVKSLMEPGGAPPSIFSMVTTDGSSAVGSTFTFDQPDPAAVAPRLLREAARFVPALGDTAIEHVRACARPRSVDGRPLLGPVPGVDGLHLVTGHGPWGISLGPGSARLVVDGVLGRGGGVPEELAAARFGAPFRVV
jgi:glycine/D-amino acid oxidase-like deaminating enzyme